MADGVFSNYQDAVTYAQAEADRYNRPMGLEAAKEYGRQVYAFLACASARSLG